MQGRARRRGHIVQMSSVGGVVGNPGHAFYASFTDDAQSQRFAAFCTDKLKKDAEAKVSST